MLLMVFFNERKGCEDLNRFNCSLAVNTSWWKSTGPPASDSGSEPPGNTSQSLVDLEEDWCSEHGSTRSSPNRPWGRRRISSPCAFCPSWSHVAPIPQSTVPAVVLPESPDVRLLPWSMNFREGLEQQLRWKLSLTTCRVFGTRSPEGSITKGSSSESHSSTDGGPPWMEAWLLRVLPGGLTFKLWRFGLFIPKGICGLPTVIAVLVLVRLFWWWTNVSSLHDYSCLYNLKCDLLDSDPILNWFGWRSVEGFDGSLANYSHGLQVLLEITGWPSRALWIKALGLQNVVVEEDCVYVI